MLNRNKICKRDKISEAKFTGCISCSFLSCYNCFRK